ncbi:TIGR04283 family arsenosugar biosynthesis glycosyltransferase [Candidatus Deferrimicrobium sp.]|uniref:TIGR04283 family arsenosugar biosynthesis glycosyltransferase n=1 Tax=Candidatus Deferrimicrobium sp. TaxID=3060586 RepID=UPI00272CCDB4|nr:TIGR04283 family arsenosugar biosynthesis glycosyltransferase [Candidatus Deferrimicrobium sp.]
MIIPALDEETSIARTIRSCREAGPCEVIVVDGGSRDRTVEIARRRADAVIAAPCGRASQMNAGAALARREVLLFLHADTLLPGGAVPAVLGALQDPAVIGGAFRVRLAASAGAGRYVRAALGITGRMIGARAAVSRSYSGDQAIFVRAEAFRVVGGYPEIPLMEDVELSRRMRRAGKTVLLPLRVETSGRRWEAWGPLRAVLFMWRVRIGHLLGRTPSRCAEAYRRGPALKRREPPPPMSSAGG